MKIWRFTNLLLSLVLLPRTTLGEDCDVQRIGERPLDDCDIFEKDLTLRVDRMIQNPTCLVRLVLDIEGKRWRFENPGVQRIVTNTIKDKCRKTNFTILTEDKVGKKKIKIFELDPTKCIKEIITAGEVSFSIAGENKVNVDVKSVLAEKPNIQQCLKGVEIEEMRKNSRTMTKYKKKGMTVNLDRSKEQNFMLKYPLHNSSPDSPVIKSLSVPRAGKLVFMQFS